MPGRQSNDTGAGAAIFGGLVVILVIVEVVKAIVNGITSGVTSVVGVFAPPEPPAIVAQYIPPEPAARSKGPDYTPQQLIEDHVRRHDDLSGDIARFTASLRTCLRAQDLPTRARASTALADADRKLLDFETPAVTDMRARFPKQLDTAGAEAFTMKVTRADQAAAASTSVETALRNALSEGAIMKFGHVRKIALAECRRPVQDAEQAADKELQDTRSKQQAARLSEQQKVYDRGVATWCFPIGGTGRLAVDGDTWPHGWKPGPGKSCAWIHNINNTEAPGTWYLYCGSTEELALNLGGRRETDGWNYVMKRDAPLPNGERQHEARFSSSGCRQRWDQARNGKR